MPTPSTVFFTDMRCPIGTSLLEKMAVLLRRAGMADIDFANRYAAIKIHFGEPGNLAFLRPNFARTVVDFVKEQGGKSFLTDCNTLYVGRRKDALEHMLAAEENGFSYLATGCHNIIADGLKGTDDIEVPVPGGEYCKTAFIGRAVMDADIFISLNHFKGHEGTGFGGAIKNIGMGCGSRAGKMQMHNDGKPEVDPAACRSCGVCQKFCAHSAISFDKAKKAHIDHEKCVGCGRCIGSCNFDAIANNWNGDSTLDYKMAEYAAAVLHGRPHFHISVVNQVSPNCDCHNESDAAIVPDIGIFASFDPVALDKACADAVMAAPVISTSLLGEAANVHKHDHLTALHPDTDWRSQLAHAEKLGIGSCEYSLVTI